MSLPETGCCPDPAVSPSLVLGGASGGEDESGVLVASSGAVAPEGVVAAGNVDGGLMSMVGLSESTRSTMNSPMPPIRMKAAKNHQML